jgi:uncharacterized protein YjbI with pentapeptide repeats
MANDDHIAQVRKGAAAWNEWRQENRSIRPDLAGANLHGADLIRANLSDADLREADLSGLDLGGVNLGYANLGAANLSGANLVVAYFVRADCSGANLSDAHLSRANLSSANLTGAKLNGALLVEATLIEAKLSAANLSRASLAGADLREADLSGADLSGAELSRASLAATDLSGANLTGAELRAAALVNTNFTGADLTGCRVYGASAWDLKLERTKQQSLIITPKGEPEITVDNIEVAQFVYLLLHNQKIRDVIDTITSKAVLILGRFTAERKAVLDALREELRKRDYLPILFDFAVPATRDITETVSLLARMARFIIADLTDPSSIPKELEAIVPSLAVPVQPLLEGSSRPYAMFKDYWKYEWVLPVYRYEGLEPLLATLAEKVIAPAEGKVKALQERRRMIEAELTKPQ